MSAAGSDDTLDSRGGVGTWIALRRVWVEVESGTGWCRSPETPRAGRKSLEADGELGARRGSPAGQADRKRAETMVVAVAPGVAGVQRRRPATGPPGSRASPLPGAAVIAGRWVDRQHRRAVGGRRRRLGRRAA